MPGISNMPSANSPQFSGEVVDGAPPDWLIFIFLASNHLTPTAI